MNTLPQHLLALATSLDGPAAETCRQAAEAIERMPKDADGDMLKPNTRYFWTKNGKSHVGYTINRRLVRRGRDVLCQCVGSNGTWRIPQDARVRRGCGPSGEGEAMSLDTHNYDQLLQRIAELEKENSRLQAIVAKLDHTLDGVPLVDGDEV